MIVIGVQDQKLQEKLLREYDLTMDNAIRFGQTSELTRKHTQELQGQSTHPISVNKINKAINYSSIKRPQPTQSYSPQQSSRSQQQQGKIKNCLFCSYEHPRGQCPAYTKNCKACGMRGHFSRCCPKKKLLHNIDERQ